ncbi:uncharacterized protein LOC107268410 [Cephus cinctus]|uniref:Uncharacterized protein LOC107268410 n=1 Tax=Cephus cinctus TaxID=211228 RepID=A0AAJ7BXF0_CEPCN|nr:uncharacterized protein LOC107268410 [Cephus cinctus]
MPNESAPICGCGVVLDLPKSRNGMTAISTKNLTILIPKTSKQSKSEVRGGKKQTEEEEAPKPQTPDTGSTSSVTEQRQPGKHTSKQKKRLNSSRRTRSAERSDSHYTYIDSGSSVVSGNGIRENTIPEAVYSTVQESPNRNVNGMSSSQVNGQNRPQPVYKIPSMTSPPPTYDVAMWQSGLPPSYEEYLCHKYAVITRSHTPPPPWSDSTPSIQQTRRDLLASQPELREFLTHLRQRAQHINNQPPHQQQQQQPQQGVLRDTTCLSNQQALRKQAARTQRPRAPPVRSQSESRAQQQRITTMYEDSAFCMETTVIQSVFDNGISFCSVM